MLIVNKKDNSDRYSIFEPKAGADWYTPWRWAAQIQSEIKAGNSLSVLYVTEEMKKSFTQRARDLRRRNGINTIGKYYPLSNGHYVIIVFATLMVHYKNIYNKCTITVANDDLMIRNARYLTNWMYSVRHPDRRVSDISKARPFGLNYAGNKGNGADGKVIWQGVISRDEFATFREPLDVNAMKGMTERELTDYVSSRGYVLTERFSYSRNGTE